jgi:carbamoyltransferase
MPVWVKEKVFLKKLIREEFAKLDGAYGSKVKLLFTDHHLAHAASAFYPSPFSSSAVLTIDGVGEWATASIGLGRAGAKCDGVKFPQSVGVLYQPFSFFGFRVNSGEYNLMGLAP